MNNFGEQRLVRDDVSAAKRLLYRIMGISDPAHYLHSVYFRRALLSLGHFNPTHILDAGCGVGDYSFYLARRYPRAQILGVDVDDHRIERNRKTAQELNITSVKFEVADLATANFSAKFDFAIAIDVLEHIIRQQEALARLFAALRPGGTAFFHLPTVRERPVPFARFLKGFKAWAAEKHLAKFLAADEFVQSVRVAGFEIKHISRTFGYYTGELATSLFALPYANSLRNQILQGILSPLCRVLAIADIWNFEDTRYAVAVLAQKPLLCRL